MSGRRERGERTPFPKGYWTIWSTVALDLIGFGIVVPILGVYAERFGVIEAADRPEGGAVFTVRLPAAG